MTTRAKKLSTDDKAPGGLKIRPKPDAAVTPAGEAGWYLERERLIRKESIGAVARACGVTPTHVRAIELGELAVFSTRRELYETLSRYADHLGFEPAPLVEHFRSFEPEQSRPRLPHRDQPMLQAASPEIAERGAGGRVVRIAVIVDGMLERARGLWRGRRPVPMVAVGAVVALLALPGVVWMMSGQGEEGDAGRPLPGVAARGGAAPPAAGAVPTVRIRETALDADVVTTDEPVSREQAERLTALIARNAVGETGSVSRSGAAAAPPRDAVASGTVYGEKSGKVRVVLRATQGVWIRVEDGSGNVLITRTLLAGDQFRVPDKKGVVLSARNAGALQYLVDGKPVGRIGEPGEIVIGYPLDARFLLRRDG